MRKSISVAMATYNGEKYIKEQIDSILLNMNENENVEAYYTIAKPINAGKDSLNGHYEMMGIKKKNVNVLLETKNINKLEEIATILEVD